MGKHNKLERKEYDKRIKHSQNLKHHKQRQNIEHNKCSKEFRDGSTDETEEGNLYTIA